MINELINIITLHSPHIYWDIRCPDDQYHLVDHELFMSMNTYANLLEAVATLEDNYDYNPSNPMNTP